MTDDLRLQVVRAHHALAADAVTLYVPPYDLGGVEPWRVGWQEEQPQSAAQ